MIRKILTTYAARLDEYLARSHRQPEGVAEVGLIGSAGEQCPNKLVVSLVNLEREASGDGGYMQRAATGYAWGNVTGSGSGTIYAGGVTGSNDLGTLTACYHAKGTVSGPGGATGGVAGRNFKDSMFGGGIITACYWGDNGQEQGIGEDQVGTGETTKVTDDDWQKAVTQMSAALQSAGSEWQYELTGALPTLKKL